MNDENETLDNLYSQDILNWLRDKAKYFRDTNGCGTLKMKFQDGYVLTYFDEYGHKVSNRQRFRTKSK